MEVLQTFSADLVGVLRYLTIKISFAQHLQDRQMFSTIEKHKPNVNLSPSLARNHDAQPFENSGQFVDTLKALSTNKVLHGLVAGGHGSSSGFGSAGSKDKKKDKKKGKKGQSDFWVEYAKISNALQYRLGFVLVNACYSKNGAKSLTSDKGISVGHGDIATPASRIFTNIGGWWRDIDTTNATEWEKPQDHIQPPQQGTGECK